MIYISNNQEYISLLAENWFSKLHKYLTEKECYDYLKDHKTKKQTKITYANYKEKIDYKINNSTLSEVEKSKCRDYVDKFFNKMEYYVLADENGLYEIFTDYEKEMIKDITSIEEHAHLFLSQLFTSMYKSFTDSKPIFEEDDPEMDIYKDISIAYYFFHKLHIQTCPYCNREYTFTVYKKKCKTRPEYDHFYDKADNPLLAVSFYNLVPSCHTCNHQKSTKQIGVNPYFKGFKSSFKITIPGRHLPLLAEQQLTPEQIHIGFDRPTAEEQLNIENLGLGDLYKMHADYAMELIEKARIYRGPMMEDLASTFQTAEYTPQQVYEFVWGKNLEDANHINRPLSKLTKDILDQLDIH